MNNTPCQFCPFAEASICLSLPPKTRCTLTGRFHRCDNTECDVKRKMISIEWIKRYASKKSANDEMDCYWHFWEEDVLEMIDEWEKENANDKEKEV